MKKKILALILALLMIFSVFAGCSSQKDGETANNAPATSNESSTNIGNQAQIEADEVDQTRTIGQAKKLVVALSTDPNDLSPWNVNNGSKPYIYSTFYEYLFDNDPLTGQYVPVIAEGYTVSDDGLSWDVKIRKGVYDHNGNSIDANDVIYAYDIQFSGGYVVKSTMFKSIELVDDYTVRFNWNKVIDGVCEVEWPLCHVVVFDKDSYESGNFATSPVGTGPYKVTKFTAGSGLTVVKNEDYWWDKAVGGERVKGHNANIDTIEFKVIQESAQQVIALQNGDIDVSYGIPNEYLGDFYGTEGFTVDKAPASMVYCIAPNLTSQFCSDINFRLAMFYALDSDALAEASGVYSVTNCIASPRFTDYHEALNKLDNYMHDYDVNMAKDYLAKTSYKGETLVFMVDNNEPSKNVASMALALWQAAGINVEIEILDGTTLNSRLNDNDWDVTLTSYGGGTLIGGWNRIMNVGDFADGNSLGHNSDSKLHELYKKTALISNMSIDTMCTLHNYVTDNAYIYAYAHQSNTYVYNTDIVADMALMSDNNTVAWGDFTCYAG